MYLRSKTELEIDTLVGKIIRDVGNPDPPLRMEDVLDRLRLDRGYYSTKHDGYLRETIHKIKVAGRQILERPGLLVDAVKKLSLKALFLPDRKRILIDSELPPTKIRWAEGHEVIHSVIPWHDKLMHGDTKQTLTPACHIQIEAEANYGNGRLLFLQQKFRDHVNPGLITMDEIKELAGLFGNSITSTLWRTVETLDFPAVGMISGHPSRPPEGFDAANPCEYLIRSRSFAETFGNIDELELFNAVRAYCGWAKRGPLGADDVILKDANGEEHYFTFETFHNSYQALTLGLHKSRRPLVFAVQPALIITPKLSGSSP
jgi:hypothetical protein